MRTTNKVRYMPVLLFIVSESLSAQMPGGQAQAGQPEFVRQGQALMREGKLQDALVLYRQVLQATPDSAPANNAAGVTLDLMGQGVEARKYFAKAIEVAPTPQSKAAAQRAMAMSYAFEGDCKKAGEYEQQVFNYYVSVKDFYQQGEIANEAGRVCIDAGDLDAAAKWYQTGHDAGLREPDIKSDRVDLWEFRWQHAQARIAARRGNAAEAEKHVAAAKTALDKLQKANQNDPFIQCLMAQTYEKLGDKEKAAEFYRKAAATTAHNPPAAYARPFARKKLS